MKKPKTIREILIEEMHKCYYPTIHESISDFTIFKNAERITKKIRTAIEREINELKRQYAPRTLSDLCDKPDLVRAGKMHALVDVKTLLKILFSPN